MASLANLCRTLCLFTLLVGGMGMANGQTYPAKPVRIVVAFPPGGGADTVTRLIGNQLTEALGQPVIVENRPGAGGSIGSDYVGRAAPDGYTLLVGPASHVIAPNFFKVGVDPIEGFVPITQLASALIVLAASATVEEDSLEAFRASRLSSAEPTTIASSGVGTVFHLAGARLSKDLNIPLQHVAYRGGGPAVADLAAGHVPIMIDTYFTFRPFVSSGKVKLWATLADGRSELLPEVPTLGELGYPDLVAENWYGLFAPAGTPDEIVKALYEKIRQVLADPDMKASLAAQGAVAVGNPPEEFARFVRDEQSKWSDVVRAHNIKDE